MLLMLLLLICCNIKSRFSCLHNCHALCLRLVTLRNCSFQLLLHLVYYFGLVYIELFICIIYRLSGICSPSASKYFRQGMRLNWPEGAVSRESMRAVRKLGRLKVCILSVVLQ